jgi:hypothetical protein
MPDHCAVFPAANEKACDVSALLATIRTNTGQIEVLYDVHCRDGHVEERWILEP